MFEGWRPSASDRSGSPLIEMTGSMTDCASSARCRLYFPGGVFGARGGQAGDLQLPGRYLDLRQVAVRQVPAMPEVPTRSVERQTPGPLGRAAAKAGAGARKPCKRATGDAGLWGRPHAGSGKSAAQALATVPRDPDQRLAEPFAVERPASVASQRLADPRAIDPWQLFVTATDLSRPLQLSFEGPAVQR
jgi:hypothetical protein